MHQCLFLASVLLVSVIYVLGDELNVPTNNDDNSSMDTNIRWRNFWYNFYCAILGMALHLASRFAAMITPDGTYYNSITNTTEHIW
uniref:Secreted protein n=1 Tax=Schistosoma mansoni TaxID=6183 RepID=A0A5K4F6M9_SCHMA